MALRGTNPGKLDRRIKLMCPVNTRDARGAEILGFAEYATRSAAWSPISSRDFLAAQSEQADVTGSFQMRYMAELETTWRIVFKNRVYEVIGLPSEIGREQMMDVMVKLLPASEEIRATAESFLVDLVEGVESQVIVYPTAFLIAPEGLLLQLVTPDGGFAFEVEASARTLVGFTADFGAVVPTLGYKLSVSAAGGLVGPALPAGNLTSQEFDLPLTEGIESLAVTFPSIFRSVPRSLKLRLSGPAEAPSFLIIVPDSSRTTAGFVAEFGAAVPSAGYSINVQANLL